MYKEIIKKAIDAKSKSYSPYSKFSVGAAVITEDGEIYSGCNIENASYTPTICAERTAIFKAISEGNRIIKKIAIIGSAKDTFPCGVCRQVIREFQSEDMEIIVANSLEDYKVFKLEDLLPYSFGPDKLKEESD